jgi:hypothetical protein
MDTSEAIQQLVDEYSRFSWYDSVGVDKLGRYVVYTSLINSEVMKAVRHDLGGKQVLIAYAHSKPGTDLRSRYMNFYDFTKRSQVPEGVVSVITNEVEFDIDYLITKLDRLEKICGSNALQDIFYEVHDGKNAVTNLSKKFPDVREGLETLYNVFGFDLIYEEIDG